MARKIPFFILIGFYIFRAGLSFSDTINLKDGSEIKGIVVEDYRDRVVISTYEGEKAVYRKDISEILYDLLEQNLIDLGDSHMRRKQFGRAYFYYEKANKVNPESRVARERMNYIMGRFFREKRQRKLDDIKRTEERDKWPLLDSIANEEYVDRLKDEIGITITLERGRTVIKNVKGKSQAQKAGIKKGDILVSVWGQLSGYLSENEVGTLLLDENIGEIRVAIEKTLTIKKTTPGARRYSDVIGGKLDMPPEGLTVTELAENGPGQKYGFKEKDRIVAINDMPTRYMPLKEAVRIIEDSKNRKLNFTVVRNTTIWRAK